MKLSMVFSQIDKFRLKRFFLFFLFCLLLWELASLILGSDNFPHFIDVIEKLYTSFYFEPKIEFQGGGSKGFSVHILNTFVKYIIGLILGIALGISLGLLMFFHKSAKRLFEPFIEAFRVVPPLIFIPFIFLFFSVSDYSQILIVLIYTSLIMSVYSLNAFLNINQNYIHIAKIYGSNTYDKIFKIILPASILELYNGIRVIIVIGTGVLVVAEYFAAPLGLGKIFHIVLPFSDVNLIFVCSIWTILITIGVDFVFQIFFLKLLIKHPY